MGVVFVVIVVVVVVAIFVIVVEAKSLNFKVWKRKRNSRSFKFWGIWVLMGLLPLPSIVGFCYLGLRKMRWDWGLGVLGGLGKV